MKRKKNYKEKLHLCPLSYAYEFNKKIDEILSYDIKEKQDFGLQEDLIQIINLIHDKRIKIIKKYVSEKEPFLFNSLTLEMNSEFFKEIFNSQNGLFLWALFTDFKSKLTINYKNYISFKEGLLDISFRIGGSESTSIEVPIRFNINETFYNLTKKYVKTS